MIGQIRPENGGNHVRHFFGNIGERDHFHFTPPKLFLADFSVVLFRSEFVLFSEQNYMKALQNQWLWARPYAPARLAGATRRGHTTVPEVQRPAQCPAIGQPIAMLTCKYLIKKHFHGVLAALHQKSGQKSDAAVNRSFLVSF
jgi:hypothetical protein